MIYLRNDDVNPSTDLEGLYTMYEAVARIFPDARFISGVTLFGVKNDKQAVYPDLPLRGKPTDFFFNVNRVLYRHSHVIGEIASHGLFHVKHNTIHADAQRMSILGSCSFLGTKKFIAPFNAYNEDTVDICKKHGIELTTTAYDWKSLEFEPFNPDHKYWTFHSWRFSVKTLLERLNAGVQARNGS